jgi:lysozyme family protein
MAGGSGKYVMIPVGPRGAPLRPEHDYLSLSLLAVHLPPGGFLNLSRFAPVVWSSLSYFAHDGENGRKQVVGMFPMEAAGRPSFARNDRMTVMDVQLTPRIIAREEQDIDFTLAQVREKDFLAGILNAASDFAGSPSAQFVSQFSPTAMTVKTAAKVAGQVKSGIDELLDNNKVKTLARFRLTLRAPVESGTFALVSADDQAGVEIDPATNGLKNRKGALRSAYVIAQLRGEASRPDWMTLPDLAQAWTRIREAKMQNGDVLAAIEHFRLSVVTSPDLTHADVEKLTRSVQARFASELSFAESTLTGDPGGMHEALDFFMGGDVGEQESAMVSVPPWMAEGPFTRSLRMLLRHEGGYVDHPADRGGPTNRGVTQKTYNSFRKAKGHATRDVRELTEEELGELYYQGYWRPAGCHEAPNEAIAALVFDASVNHSPRAAVRQLQQSADMPIRNCDGRWGPKTRARVLAAAADPVSLVDACLLTREGFYRQIVRDDPKQGVFLRGWMNRLTGLRDYVMPMLVKAPDGAPTESALFEDNAEAVGLRAADPDFSGMPAPAGATLTAAE